MQNQNYSRSNRSNSSPGDSRDDRSIERGGYGGNQSSYSGNQGDYDRNPSGYGGNQGGYGQSTYSSQGTHGNQSSDGNQEHHGNQGGRGPFQGKGPKGYMRSDERIREEVCELLSSGHLDASDIEVLVQSGDVTLSGTVSDRRTKRMVEELLDNVSGIKDFNNYLKVKGQGSLETFRSAGGNGQMDKESSLHRTTTRSSDPSRRTLA